MFYIGDCVCVCVCVFVCVCVIVFESVRGASSERRAERTRGFQLDGVQAKERQQHHWPEALPRLLSFRRDISSDYHGENAGVSAVSV